MIRKKKNLCKCGCGTKVLHTYARGHNPMVLSAEHKQKLLDSHLGKSLTEATKNNISRALQGIIRSEETCQKISAAVKQTWENPEYKERLAESKRQTWKDPAYKARLSAVHSHTHSTATKVKRGESMKLKWQDPAFRVKQSISRKRWCATPEGQAHLVQAGKASMRLFAHRTRQTKPEIAVEEILRAMGLKFIPQCEIIIGKQQYFVDFYLTDFNTCIEVDGLYWHGPQFMVKDQIREANIKAQGYKILRVWEDEIQILETKLLEFLDLAVAI